MLMYKIKKLDAKQKMYKIKKQQFLSKTFSDIWIKKIYLKNLKTQQSKYKTFPTLLIW